MHFRRHWIWRVFWWNVNETAFTQLSLVCFNLNLSLKLFSFDIAKTQDAASGKLLVWTPILGPGRWFRELDPPLVSRHRRFHQDWARVTVTDDVKATQVRIQQSHPALSPSSLSQTSDIFTLSCCVALTVRFWRFQFWGFRHSLKWRANKNALEPNAAQVWSEFELLATKWQGPFLVRSEFEVPATKWQGPFLVRIMPKVHQYIILSERILEMPVGKIGTGLKTRLNIFWPQRWFRIEKQTFWVFGDFNSSGRRFLHWWENITFIAVDVYIVILQPLEKLYTFFICNLEIFLHWQKFPNRQLWSFKRFVTEGFECTQRKPELIPHGIWVIETEQRPWVRLNRDRMSVALLFCRQLNSFQPKWPEWTMPEKPVQWSPGKPNWLVDLCVIGSDSWWSPDMDQWLMSFQWPNFWLV